MTNPREFLTSWVRDNVEANSYRNKAEARRLTYECRRASDEAHLSWQSVIQAAGGDVQGYVQSALDRAADREAEHI